MCVATVTAQVILRLTHYTLFSSDLRTIAKLTIPKLTIPKSDYGTKAVTAKATDAVDTTAIGGAEDECCCC